MQGLLGSWIKEEEEVEVEEEKEEAYADFYNTLSTGALVPIYMNSQVPHTIWPS